MDEFVASEDEFLYVKPLQKKLLEILAYFDAFCKEHGIVYITQGGTTLGAARHQGFVPWDDDVDVILTQPEYEKLLRLWPKYGDEEKFHLQVFCAEHHSMWAKLRANGTTFIEENVRHKHIHQGVFIDIMTMQTCPDGKWARRWQYAWAKYLVAQEWAFKNNPPKGIKWIDRALGVMRHLPRFFLASFAARQVKRFEGQATGCYSKFTDGGMAMHYGLIKKTIIGTPKPIPFENLIVMGPEHPEEYLTMMYGDWRSLPPVEARKSHHTYYSVEQDFRDYLGFTDLDDEKYI